MQPACPEACPTAHFLIQLMNREKEIMEEQELLEKIRQLPPAKQREVELFVHFLTRREEDLRLAQVAARLSEEAFRQVWDNEADSAYDKL